MAVVDSADLIINNGLIDVVIDATGVPAVGAELDFGRWKPASIS